MAKISTYNIDTNITGSELLVGTEANSSPPNLTKNFKVEDVFSYVWGWRYIEHYIDDPNILRNLVTNPFVLLPSQGNNVGIIPLQLTLITYGQTNPAVAPINQYQYGLNEMIVGLDDGTGMVGANPWWSGVGTAAMSTIMAVDSRSMMTFSSPCSLPGIATTPYTVNIAETNKAFLWGGPPLGNNSVTGTMPVKVQFSYQIFSF